MNKTKEEIAKDIELAADIKAVVTAMLCSFDVETEISAATRTKMEEERRE